MNIELLNLMPTSNNRLRSLYFRIFYGIKPHHYRYIIVYILNASVVYWSEFLDPEVPVLPDFLSSSGPRTESIQPREDN
jgi:hypothetical protein